MQEKIYQTIHSLKEIQPLLAQPDEALLVFDVDYTLTHPLEPAFQFKNFKENVEVIQPIFTGLSAQERDIFANLMVFHITGSHLIEKDTASWIQRLQLENYKIIALTASLTAPIKEECLIKKRIENLNRLGLDFSKAFEKVPRKSYKEMPPNFNCHPHYEEGILFTNGENKKNYKGELLVEFLSSLEWTPKQIIFVDDRPLNLQVVHEALQNEFPEIDYIGLHFLGALSYPSEEISKDEFLTKIQSLAAEAKTLSKRFSKDIK